MIQPDYAKWNRPVFPYDGVEAFLRSPNFVSGVHTVNCDGLPVDLLFHRKNADTLLVVFGAAAPRSAATSPPFFSGLGLASDLRCSTLCVNDPSYYLDEGIRIAWYVGSKRVLLQPILPAIFDAVATRSNCRRIIFTGGSAGGFACLYYVLKTAFPAMAFAFNPQTNISKYDPAHLKLFARVCFDWQEGQEVEASYASLIDYDVVRLYQSPPRPPVLYLQNKPDWHIKVHAAPFLQTYGVEWTGQDQVGEDRLYLHVGHWGDGHIPPPKTVVQECLKFLCDWRGSWQGALTSPALGEVVVRARDASTRDNASPRT